MKKITIYTTPFCPFCVRAKQFFQQNEMKFEEIDVERNPELRRKISSANNGFRTVPMIFVGDIFIGGYDDLEQSVRSGQFENLIK